MDLKEALAIQAGRFNKKSGDTDFTDIATPLINLGYLDVGKSWPWTQLKTDGSILAIPIYSTGTAALVLGSFTVTIAGGTLTAAMKGRFFRKKGGSNNYRIVNVDTSAGTLTLDQAIVETSESAAEYEIEKRFYTAPTEVRQIISWDRAGGDTLGLDNRAFREVYPSGSSRNSPLVDVPFEVHGTDEFTDDYTEGTVAVTANSAVVTGTGNMEWLTYAKPGNIMRFSDVNYRVRRVEGNKRIVLYNKVEEAIDSITYAIKVDNALTLRPFGTFTENRVIRFHYIRSVFDLIHDDDTIELSREAGLAVHDFADAYITEALGKDGWQGKLLKAQARLQRAQQLADPVKSAFRMFAPLIPRGNGRR